MALVARSTRLIFQFQKDQAIIAGMPGIQKAQRMFRPRPSIERLPVLEDRGGIWFHGVYRTLAQNLGIVDDQNRLMGVGAELAEAHPMGIRQVLSGWWNGTKRNWSEP